MHAHVSMLWLAAFAGAIHVLAPDHWVPSTYLCWHRRWGVARSALFFTLALVLHVLLGAGLYFALQGVLSEVPAAQLLFFTVVFVLAVMAIRAFRFSRTRGVQRLGMGGFWGLLAVFSFLGPCEAMLPILMKSSQLGIGYFAPFAAFLLGSLAAGVPLVLAGRWVWSRPYWISRAYGWVHQRLAMLPAFAGMALGFRYLLRMI